MAQVVVELTGDEAKLLRSMQRVIDQNAKVGDSFKKMGKESDNIDSGISKGLATLGRMVTVAASVDLGFQAIGVTQQKFIDRMQQSVGLINDLANAQQEAVKNLAGNSESTISDVLQNQVPEIALKANFSDLSKITTALGSVSSIVGEEKSASIVEAAANVTRFKKDDLQSTATSTADIVKAAGLTDGREAMSLLLTSGAVARPEELPKLASGASKAIYAGVNASPNQAPVEAAKSSAALFSLLTKVDKQGESAATASIQLEELLRTTFNPTQDEAIKRDERLKELLDKAETTNDERLQIERARVTLQGKESIAKRIRPEDKSMKAESVRLGVEEARAALLDAQKDAGLNDKEAEELRRIQVQKSFAGMDPGTFKGRLDVVRQEPELKRTVEANLKGEAAFRPIMQGLFDANSTHSKELDAAMGSITTDVSKFDAAMKTMEITAQQTLAAASEKVATAIAVKDFKDVDLQTYGKVDEILKKALDANPTTGITAFQENVSKSIAGMFDMNTDSVSTYSSSPEQAISSAIMTLKDQQVQVGDWSTGDVSKMSAPAQAKIGNLQTAIDTLETMRTSLAMRKADSPMQTQQKPMGEMDLKGGPVNAQATEIMGGGARSLDSTSERGAREAGTSSIEQAAERMAQATNASAKAIEEQNRMMIEQTNVLKEIKDKRQDPEASSSAIRAQVLASQQK